MEYGSPNGPIKGDVFAIPEPLSVAPLMVGLLYLIRARSWTRKTIYNHVGDALIFEQGKRRDSQVGNCLSKQIQTCPFLICGVSGYHQRRF